jgi:hypothetical protein
MAKNENENPDGGYEHFHEHGTRAPHKLVKAFPDKRAAHSGPHTMGKPKGVEPDEELPPMGGGPGGNTGGGM